MNGSISTAEYHRMQAKLMTEAQLQAAIIAAAQRRDWLVYHTHDSRRSQPGFPDLVLVHAQQGRILYRELKTQTGKHRPDQKIWLRDLAAAGADAGTWRPLDWFDGTVSRELDEPAPDFKAFAAELGIELLDWQVTVAENMWRANPSTFTILGRPIRTDGGRIRTDADRATTRRMLQHFASLEQNEHRTITTRTEGVQQ